jgi:hypothetical protein
MVPGHPSHDASPLPNRIGRGEEDREGREDAPPPRDAEGDREPSGDAVDAFLALWAEEHRKRGRHYVRKATDRRVAREVMDAARSAEATMQIPAMDAARQWVRCYLDGTAENGRCPLAWLPDRIAGYKLQRPKKPSRDEPSSPPPRPAPPPPEVLATAKTMGQGGTGAFILRPQPATRAA